jgi:hypothetical protein
MLHVRTPLRYAHGTLNTKAVCSVHDKAPILMQRRATSDQSKATSDQSKATPDQSKATPDQSKATSDQSKATSDQSKATSDQQSNVHGMPTTRQPPAQPIHTCGSM